MTHLLPANLLKLFAPRPPLTYAKPLERDPTRGKRNAQGGVGELLQSLREQEEDKLAQKGGVNDTQEQEQREGVEATTAQSQLATMYQVAQRKADRKKKRADTFKRALEHYNPSGDAEAIGDPFKTLFIARLTPETAESDLRKEFEVYGPVERVRIVRHKDTGKSRRYAFIIYEKERDMKAAYKDAEGLKIHGNRILVDVERGRTVKGWKPRRLGGGLGGKPKVVLPDMPPPRGGRGGFGGGFRGGPRRSDGGGRFGGPPGGGRFGRDRDGPPRFGGGGFGDRERGDRDRFGGDRGDRGGDRPMRQWGGAPRDRDRDRDRDGPRRSFGGFKRDFDGGEDRESKRYRY